MTYTREQLKAMPDRELDAVVAKVVMGWKWLHVESKDYDGKLEPHDVLVPAEWSLDDVLRMYPPRGILARTAFVASRYSTDIAAAWEVVKRITPRAAQVDVWARRGGKYACYVHGVDGELWKEGDFADDVFVEADTAPRAISINAVLAVQEANK